MKKLLGISTLVLLLTACSSSNEHSQVAQIAKSAPSSLVEEALKACQASVGESKDQMKFDACMKDKGFERAVVQQEQVAQQGQAAVTENMKAVKPKAKRTVKNTKTK